MNKILLVIFSVGFLSIIGYNTIDLELYKSLYQMRKHVSAQDRAGSLPEEYTQQSYPIDLKDEEPAANRRADSGGTISKESLNSPLKNEIVFSSKEDALKFLLSKFSQKELEGFVQKTRDGVSSEELQEIMLCVFSRLSPGEYKALEAFVLSELGKERISMSELKSIAAQAQNGAHADTMAGIKAALHISPEEYGKLEIVVLNELNKNNNN